MEKLLAELPNVERILCFNTGLKEVPQVISEFKRLSIVRIDQNKLTAFPDLPNAVEVDASSNALTSFPAVRLFQNSLVAETRAGKEHQELRPAQSEPQPDHGHTIHGW